MAAASDYDSTAAALAEFHSSRSGVRGLVESGVDFVPPLFLTPTTTSDPAPPAVLATIPTVDLSLPRSAAVHLVGAAARTCGFFHVVNHGVHADDAVSAVRSFHELPLAVRSAFYTRTHVRGVSYSTLPYSPAQNGGGAAGPVLPWRDTLQVILRSQAPEPDLGLMPEAGRDALVEYLRRLGDFGKEIAGILREALGVGEERLTVERAYMVGHYYPPCPEPARVAGALGHTDPSVFTVLAEDAVGGLQVRLDGGGWADVPPVPGALLVNIGDVLKLVSNDEYKSAEHRVRITSSDDARVSVGVFFNPAKRGDEDFLGPFPELVTAETPAVYRRFTMKEFMDSRKEFGHGILSTDRFRVADE